MPRSQRGLTLHQFEGKDPQIKPSYLMYLVNSHDQFIDIEGGRGLINEGRAKSSSGTSNTWVSFEYNKRYWNSELREGGQGGVWLMRSGQSSSGTSNTRVSMEYNKSQWNNEFLQNQLGISGDVKLFNLYKFYIGCNFSSRNFLIQYFILFTGCGLWVEIAADLNLM